MLARFSSSLLLAFLGALLLQGTCWATLPKTPSGITVSATSAPNGRVSILVQWTDNSDDEDFFVVFARKGTSGSYGHVAQVNANETYAVFQPSATSSIKKGDVFQFIVLACKGSYDSSSRTLKFDTDGWALISEQSTLPTPVSLSWPGTASTFATPTNLAVAMRDGTKGDGVLKFTLTDNSDSEERYELQFRTSGGSDTDWKTVNAAFSLPTRPADQTDPVYWPCNQTTHYLDLSKLYAKTNGDAVRLHFDPGVTYEWRVRAVRSNAASSGYEQTDWATSATLAMPAVLKPTNFTVTSEGENALRFSWEDNSQNEDNYLLQRSIDSGTTFTTVQTLERNATSTSVSSYDKPSTSTLWRVVAAYVPTSGSASTAMQTASDTVTITSTFGAPTGLTATVDDDPTQPRSIVKLKWTDHSSVETNFEIRYRLSSDADVEGNYTRATLIDGSSASAPSSVTTTLTTELPPGKALTLQVRAAVVSGSTTVFSSPVAVDVTTKNGFTGSYNPVITVDSSFTYTLATSADSSITALSVTGLPPGLSFDEPTKKITGTPTKGGLYEATMLATFGSKSATETLHLRVTYPPGPPRKPVTLTSRTIGLNTPVLIPLTKLFDDPDTEQVVQLSLNVGNGQARTVRMLLYPSLTPATVTNFMSYVNAGDYTNVVFHRSESSFVIQGGGYRLDTNFPVSPPVFKKVTARPSPVNEPGISNLLGTIAMAKLPSQPNSATSEFFFNLGDNSANLDAQNSGFTVFGRVASPDLSVINEIKALQTKAYSFQVRDATTGKIQSLDVSNVPVTGTTAPTTLTSNAMVVITGVTQLSNALTYSTPTSSSPSNVTATVQNGNLRLVGVADGTSTVLITATDVEGNSTTQSFTVTADAAYAHPSITQEPGSLTVNELDNASFNVIATGTGLTYQWFKDGAAIAGATSDTLNLTGVHLSDIGDYTVAVSNDATSVTSAVAHLQVLKSLVIQTPPQGATVTYLNSHTLSVVAVGSPPLTYQWSLNGTDLNGATSDTYFISSMTAARAGDYRVRVGSASGTETSTAATIVFKDPDTDGDGLKDSVEDAAQLDKTKADTDGDGYSDYVEQQLGSNPLLASSTPASKPFVAARDGETLLRSLLMKRIPEASNLPDRLNSGNPTNTVAYWLGAYELTNQQFAAILELALRRYSIIEVTKVLGVRAVRYPVGGNVICYLAEPSGATATDIRTDAHDMALNIAGTTFIVDAAQANLPVRAVSWEGACLAANVMNRLLGFTAKNTGDTAFAASSVSGYRLPSYAEWEVAARGGYPSKNYLYPTGNSTPSASQAWFNQTSLSAVPKKVGSYAASYLGCYDLAGNVAEWVSTSSGTDYYVRGGSFADAVSSLDNGAHDLLGVTAIDRRVGVRLALDGAATPTVTIAPAHLLVRSDQPISIVATATGAPTLGYQWLRGGSALSTQKQSVLSIAAPKTSDAGSYQVRVTSNGINPVTSTTAYVSVVQVPSVTDVSVAAGSTATLEVPYGAASGHTLSFAWFKNGVRMSNYRSVITGTSANKLVIKNCLASTTGSSTTDTGVYTCEVRTQSATGLTAVQVNFLLRVLRVPVPITPVFPNHILVSESFLYQMTYTTDGSQSPTKWTATGLPSGLTINSSSGLISGKPLTSGTFSVTITASNATGSASTSKVTLTVDALNVNAIGTFAALVGKHPLTGVDAGLNNGLGGRLDITTTKTGLLTGKLTLGASVFSVSGALDTQYNSATTLNPTATITVARKGQTSLLLELAMDLFSDRLLTGNLSELTSAGLVSSNTTTIYGWVNRWNNVTQAVNYNGLHNVALRIPTASVGNAVVPQGSGYAAVNVSLLGSTTFVGKLADGTAISSSAYVGPVGQHLVYQTLYSGKGSLIGIVSESFSSGKHYFSGTDGLGWIKRAQTTLPGDRLYAATGIDTTLTPVGGLFTPTSSGALIMNLASTTPNAAVDVSGGGITAFSQNLSIRSPAVVSFTGVPTNPKSLTCSINSNTGAFSGSFKLSDPDPTSSAAVPPTIARTVSYQGLIVPDSTGLTTNDFGEGFFTIYGLPSATTTIKTSPILSGKVRLRASP